MVYKTTPSAHISLALPEYGAPKDYEKLFLIHTIQSHREDLQENQRTRQENLMFLNIPLKTSGLIYAGLPR